mgnify:CR=1 FL=1|jgi:hypothetical protein
MNILTIESSREVPKTYTGIAEFSNGRKSWYKDGLWHREDGPAYETPSGYKQWWLENLFYDQINLKDYIVLDHDKGKCGIMWYRLLDKDQIIEYPDIPGLITK